jgi:hypothetical protein
MFLQGVTNNIHMLNVNNYLVGDTTWAVYNITLLMKRRLCELCEGALHSLAEKSMWTTLIV